MRGFTDPFAEGMSRSNKIINLILMKLLPYRDIVKTVDGKDSLYLRRFYLKRNGKTRCFLHYFARSDDDRFLHDHPWDFFTIILNKGYMEEIKGGKYRFRNARSGRFHPAEWLHRIHLTEGPVWTLFFPKQKRREWGFQTNEGWVSHTEYLANDDRADTITNTKAPIV